MRLACARHLRDLTQGPARGLRWDPDAVEDQRLYFAGLRHSKGEWAGRAVALSPWQLFVQGCVYGWRRADGTRRYRICYLEVAKKNGKSTQAAGNGLYLAFDDDEPGAECYAAATKRAQAKVTWDEARRMVLSTPSLRQRITALRDNLSDHITNSKYEPLGADADSLDGPNPNGLTFDELHAHKTRALWDVLMLAMGARRQPLAFVTTTAGYDRHSICWEQHDHAVKVLEGVLEDDAFFAFIASLDACATCREAGKIAPTEGCPGCDDWRDERCWPKSNPNLNVSVKLDTLREECRRAQEAPAARAPFLRLRMNLWDQRDTRAINIAAWNACRAPADLAALRGRRCYAGLDLASTDDLAALVLVFPEVCTPDPDVVARALAGLAQELAQLPAEEVARRRAQVARAISTLYRVVARFWMPRDNVITRVRAKRVPYDVWAAQGLITLTEGNVIDYDVIRRDINALADQVQIVEIAVDRWNATQITTQLESDGLTMIPFGQGFSSMAAPTKELVQALIPGRRIAHGGNPVLTWQAGNLVVKTDAAGNMKPDRERSAEKIDGMVALIMALDRASRHDDAAAGVDVYVVDPAPERADAEEPPAPRADGQEDAPAPPAPSAEREIWNNPDAWRSM